MIAHRLFLYSALLTASLFSSTGILAQSAIRTETRTLEWKPELRKIEDERGKLVDRPDFKGVFYQREGRLPEYRERLRVSGKGELSVQLVNAVYEPLRSWEWAQGLDLPNGNPRVALQVVRKQPYAVVTVPAVRQGVAGRLEKLVSFELDVRQAPALSNATSKAQIRSGRAADNSVLASGDWYKLALSQDGIYRLDRSFLESMGINVGAINPSGLGIFGNGGGMVPEDIDDSRVDDLQENAIRLVGMDDGSFDNGDYILFYGQGPDRWELIDDRFEQVQNIYEDRTYYYLTTNRGTGKRVQERVSSSASATQSTSTFDDYAFVEDENENLLQSGREWFGDFFDAFTNSRDYSFSFPNRVSGEEVWLKARAAHRSAVSGVTYQFRVNGSSVLDIPLSSITIGFEQLYASNLARSTTFSDGSDNLTVTVQYPTGDGSARGWLDYITVNTRREIRKGTGTLFFRDSRVFGSGQVTNFTVFESDGAEIWDVTDPTTAVRQQTSGTGTQTYRAETDVLREFAVFRTADLRTDVEFVEVVRNQNLHNPPTEFPDLIVVSHPDFIDQARRLAGFHADRDGMDTVVANIFKVYNEFGSGCQGPGAIRDYAKMFYDRATDESEMPRYLLLFGDGSYDFKNIEFSAEVNQNFIPAFESQNSTHPIFTYTSDDFFGFLDAGEGGSFMNDDEMGIDLAIGRLPVKTPAEAQNVVNKIFQYVDPSSYGSWRNVVTFVADDEDFNRHIDDADEIAQEVVADIYPQYNVDKIYLDAYQQTSASGGERYPAANEAINNRMFRGSLIMNYTGHGSERSWAQERVLGEGDISSWENWDKLPLFVTATCSFSRYDDPNATSAGEQTLLSDKGGSIGLITTVRLVFANANFQINREIFRTIFEPLPDGTRPTLGDVIQEAKNNLAAVSSDGQNNRKFTLLGDPALRMAYPEYEVVTTVVNGQPSGIDTIGALEKVTIEGEVRAGGVLVENFNGVVFPTLYDKSSTLATLSNDPLTSPVKDFELQNNIIYRGKASVTNGRFSFTFIVPKDINYNIGTGKISYYAENGIDDGGGADIEVVIGGTADSAALDNSGPQVNIFMNNEAFAFGGITDENPIMLVKLEDESGINTVGNGIGHDITSFLDDEDVAVILNDFYEADLDSYQSGSVRYRLQDLESGRHSITVKAWDVYNNSGEGYTEFVVAESAELALDHVLNYPNPFTTQTEFMFEHNRPGDMLNVKVEIFSPSGRRVKTIQQDVISEGFRIAGIDWDGLDDFGDAIGRGVYVYKVSVRSLSDPSVKASQSEKLVVLR